MLHEPENPRALAAALRQMILDPDAAARQGLAAQQAIRDRYTDDIMAAAPWICTAAWCAPPSPKRR